MIKLYQKKLKEFKVSNDDYQKYLDHCTLKLDDIENTRKEKSASKQLEINRISGEQTKYIKDMMPQLRKMDEMERKIYENEKKKYESRIDFLQQELKDLSKKEREMRFLN